MATFHLSLTACCHFSIRLFQSDKIKEGSIGIKKTYKPFTLMGLTVTRPVSDPLAVLNLDNQLCIPIKDKAAIKWTQSKLV